MLCTDYAGGPPLISDVRAHMLPPPESIVPPVPRIRAGVKVALVALLITVVLAALGVAFSFYIAHGASFAERAIATIVFWPAFVVILAFGELGMPHILFHTLAFGVEFLYVWGIVSVVARVVRAS